MQSSNDFRQMYQLNKKITYSELIKLSHKFWRIHLLMIQESLSEYVHVLYFHITDEHIFNV